MNKINLVQLVISVVCLTACGKNSVVNLDHLPLVPKLNPLDVMGSDESIVHGRAIYTVTDEQQTAMMKTFNNLFAPQAYAGGSGGTSITYTNSASTTFTINVAGLVASGFTGSTLSLGSVSVSGLSDNNLKVCGDKGNAHCSQAVIRIYTTGSVAGFVNKDDNYGVPVYAGALNPSQAVGLDAAGSVQVQTVTLDSSKHTTALVDFKSPTYGISANFSNGGAGSYSMNLVVEYALLP